MNKKNEKLLREFVRQEVLKPLLNEYKEEQKARQFARAVIQNAFNFQTLETLFESKDMTNPHPNTGINKLRDSIRKAKPSIKTKYQQLTSNKEQRDSFRNHFLSAMVRLFDELDALNADDKIVDSIDIGDGDTLEKPPEESPEQEDEEISNLEDQISQLAESILKEAEEDEETPINLVAQEEEQEREKTQAEKDFNKKQDLNKKREEFGDGLEGDATGRNQAFDTFNLVQTYFSDSYLDLDSDEDKNMFKKWCLYNLKLLLDKYEDELNLDIEEPNIENPT
jgi:hypothetical protein